VVRNRLVLGAALLLAAPCASPASPERYVVRAGDDGSSVKFVSKAAMEVFEGKTHAVTGRVTLDPGALGDTLDISVSVDMTRLATGIALRDRHMRENHLHTERFPIATFEGGRIAEGTGPLAVGQARRVALDGTLTIHGVARRVTLPVDLARDATGTLRLVAEFPVALADHGIPRPKFLVLKLGEVPQVSVSIVADPDPATSTMEAPTPVTP
jgi:polyisoprenoid-binding protein YceI